MEALGNVAMMACFCIRILLYTINYFSWSMILWLRMDEPFFFGSSALIEISAELTLPFPQKRGNKSALFHISNTTMSSQYTQKICVLLTINK